VDEGFARELRSTSSGHGLRWERALLVPSKSLEKKAPAAVGVGVVVVAGTVAGADDVGRGLYAAAIVWFLFVLESLSRELHGTEPSSAGAEVF